MMEQTVTDQRIVTSMAHKPPYGLSKKISLFQVSCQNKIGFVGFYLISEAVFDLNWSYWVLNTLLLCKHWPRKYIGVIKLGLVGKP